MGKAILWSLVFYGSAGALFGAGWALGQFYSESMLPIAPAEIPMPSEVTYLFCALLFALLGIATFVHRVVRFVTLKQSLGSPKQANDKPEPDTGTAPDRR